MSCESDNGGIWVFSVDLFPECGSKEELVIMSIKERSEAEADSFWQFSVKLPVKCQSFLKILFRIICGTLLKFVALFYNECSREYSKDAGKPSLKEIKTAFLRYVVCIKFALSSNKFPFNLVALNDTTGAFKFSRQWK